VLKLILLLAILPLMVSSVYADLYNIETADNDLALPGCLDSEIGCYTPNILTVEIGDTITMTNTDEAGIHTFTSGTVDGFSPSPDGIFDSGMLMKPGDSFEYTTDTVGEFPYYCMLHPWMQGKIIVNSSNQFNITVEEGIEVPGVGKTIQIKVIGAQQTVEIKIIAEDGEILFDSSFPSSSQGETNQPWLIPKDMPYGTYTITATDSRFNFTQTTFEYEANSIIIIPEKQLILTQKQLIAINYEITHFEKKLTNLQTTIDSQQIRLDRATLNNYPDRIEKITANIDGMTALQNIYELLIFVAQNQIILYS